MQLFHSSLDSLDISKNLKYSPTRPALEQLTGTDQSRDMAIACHFSIRNLLDGAVYGVEERFCFVCSRHDCHFTY